ncbi:FAD/NAD(P)-binding domain-containing protein [Cryphonectria parasitica EP155]|uniref:FAD/NAD(P)-binding domain-containing protein n=1 Tax=Cryphonectria parasitica (strain ATCC 38755 / EP155) TaxID=660469 RepID=A0A9P4Y2W2_CRYP1|nr:FAD/NAD(P)-binding domain-containing protein [Cryphonectria parasitica EP155]KAF3765165.1 FAD/NAD(P)-binding domain-containing protein [Cryphonectria parasitica EP155]
MDLDTDVLIIGAGLSGLGFAIQLQKTYGTTTCKFEIIEKSDSVGGTWWLNSYPGCGCDVPSHFYSYSWALNPNWTRKYALQPEIHAYLGDLATRYDIERHTRLHTAVQGAVWDEQTATWLVTLCDQVTGETAKRRCKVLVSAVGSLSVPRECEIPGADKFQGRLFHTARWDHDFDWAGKDVVIIGNGCSATQIVPSISEGGDTQAVHKVTQFSRQAHWLSPRQQFEYSTIFKLTMRWVPFAMRVYRAWLYYEKEVDFLGYRMNKGGAGVRAGWTKTAAEYIRANAPEKYREFLVPTTEVGCKRRVNDTDYLAALHRDNVELVYDDPVEEIVREGVVTRSGRFVGADAVVLANGFQTKKMLFPMEIVGRGGVSLHEHWTSVSEGVPSAYFGTCVSNAPNFFMLMGPNSVSGHVSVVYTSECQTNFILRMIRPIMSRLEEQHRQQQASCRKTDVVAVKPEAERRDLEETQTRAKELVWASGCTSWGVDEVTGRNFAMYPDWQFVFWFRSFWIRWRDFSLWTTSSGGYGKGKSKSKTV